MRWSHRSLLGAQRLSGPEAPCTQRDAPTVDALELALQPHWLRSAFCSIAKPACHFREAAGFHSSLRRIRHLTCKLHRACETNQLRGQGPGRSDAPPDPVPHWGLPDRTPTSQVRAVQGAAKAWPRLKQMGNTFTATLAATCPICCFRLTAGVRVGCKDQQGCMAMLSAWPVRRPDVHAHVKGTQHTGCECPPLLWWH